MFLWYFKIYYTIWAAHAQCVCTSHTLYEVLLFVWRIKLSFSVWQRVCFQLNHLVSPGMILSIPSIATNTNNFVKMRVGNSWINVVCVGEIEAPLLCGFKKSPHLVRMESSRRQLLLNNLIFWSFFSSSSFTSSDFPLFTFYKCFEISKDWFC